MKSLKILFAVLLVLPWINSATAENLGDILRDSGWDKIVGTWLDAETRGNAIKTTYKWRFEDHVLEVTTRAGDTKSAGLIALSGQTGDVFHVGADNKGGTGLGKWADEDGDAVLELGFVTADGDEGELRIRHHLKDDDTMVVTIEADGEPVTMTMVRAKK